MEEKQIVLVWLDETCYALFYERPGVLRQILDDWLEQDIAYQRDEITEEEWMNFGEYMDWRKVQRVQYTEMEVLA